jgi:hypothetical protein
MEKFNLLQNLSTEQLTDFNWKRFNQAQKTSKPLKTANDDLNE